MPDKPNIATQLFHDLGVMSPAEAEAKYGQHTVPTADGELRLSFVKPPPEGDLARARDYRYGESRATEPYVDNAPGLPYATIGPYEDYRRNLADQFGPGGYGVPTASGGSELDDIRRKHLAGIREYARGRLAEVDAIPDMGPYQVGKTLQQYKDLVDQNSLNRDDVALADIAPDRRLPDGTPVDYKDLDGAYGRTASVTPPYMAGKFWTTEPSARIQVDEDLSATGRKDTLMHERMHQRQATAAEPEAYPTVNRPVGAIDLSTVDQLDKRVETAVASRYAGLRAFEKDLYRMTNAVAGQKGPRHHEAQRALLRFDAED